MYCNSDLVYDVLVWELKDLEFKLFVEVFEELVIVKVCVCLYVKLIEFFKNFF